MVDNPSFEHACKTLFIAGAAAAVTACATVYAPPPNERLAVADAAVADAVSAGAPEYAAVDYRNARQRLDRAHAAATAGDNLAARNLAEEAEADARLAATRARSAKDVRAAAEVHAGIRALRDETARTRP